MLGTSSLENLISSTPIVPWCVGQNEEREK